MAIIALKNAAIAMEDTAGVAVDPPIRSIPALWTLNRQITRAQREGLHRRSFANVNRSFPVATDAGLSLETDATFELLAYLFHVGIKGDPSRTPVNFTPAPTQAEPNPTEERVGTSWNFTPSVDELNDPKTMTLHVQDEHKRYIVPFVFAQSLELEFPLNAAVVLRGEFLGNYPTRADITAGDVVEIPESAPMIATTETVVEVDFGNTGVYDTLTNAVLAARLRMPSGFTPQGYLDGGLNYNKITEGKRRWELELDIEHGDEGDGLFEALTKEQDNRVRLTHTGATLGGSDTARKLTVEMSVAPSGDTVEMLADRDERSTLPVTFGTVPLRAGGDEGRDILNVELICGGDDTITS